nr:Rab family GTPase [Candidatus Sigynarchaeota archaeon]
MDNSNRSSHIFKIVAGGAGGVGKTTFFLRYTNGLFLSNTSMTVGVAFHTRDIIKDQAKIKIFAWDLSGQPRFRCMQDTYLLGAVAGMLFFDLSRPESISEVHEWVNLLRTKGSPSMPIILIGTKLDLVAPEQEAATIKAGESMADLLGLSFFIKTSSKTDVNVSEAFDRLVELLLQKQSSTQRAITPAMQVFPTT